MKHLKSKAHHLDLLDVFRGIALIFMAIYHLIWDLSYFSYLPPETATTGDFALFAQIIAASFLFIAGFSLYLAHRKFIDGSKFIKRFGILIFCAMLIMTSTYFYTPENMIYFGILHEIALTSALGLLFLRTPILLNIVVIIAVLYAPIMLIPKLGHSIALDYIGLSSSPRPSLDYVPFFPWFSAGLLGITVARIMEKLNWLRFLRYNLRPKWLNNGLKFLGQHSLFFYLVHQPLLFGLMYLAANYMPPHYAYLREPMINSCMTDCQTIASADICRNYCGCMFENLLDAKLIKPLNDGEINIYDARVYNILLSCQKKSGVSD